MTKKDGTRGRLKIDYGNPKEPEAAIKWLWKYVDGARNAGELYGRALVVMAAEQYAARIVLPASQRTYRTHWGSRKDLAARALKKLAASHLPTSLRQLERAIERVHAEHRRLLAQDDGRENAAAEVEGQADTGDRPANRDHTRDGEPPIEAA